MEPLFQDATSLSDYHWLFSDELAPEDAHLPAFVPRVLNFEKSRNPSHQFSFCNTPLRLRPNGSRVEAMTPNFTPQEYLNQSCIARTSEISTDSTSACETQQTCLTHDLNGIPKQHGLKRRNEYSYDNHKRKNPRLSGHDSTTSATVNPDQLQSLMELPRLEERNSFESAELSESKRCITFLVNEIHRVIESNRYRENSEMTHRMIKQTESRLKSFIQTSRVMSQITTAQDGSYAPTSNNNNTYNPFSYNHDANQIASMEFDPINLTNPFNLTSCCAAPLEGRHTCDYALFASREAATSCTGTSLTRDNTFSSRPASLNPMIENGLTTQNFVNASPDFVWLENVDNFRLNN